MSSLFEQTLTVDHAQVKQIALEHWGLELGAIIKASQNHTFSAEDPVTRAKYALRVTPDPAGKHLSRLVQELTFVNFLASRGLEHVCSPVARQDVAAGEDAGVGRYYVVRGDLVVSAYVWAKGSAVPIFEYAWLQNAALIRQWGGFMARMHALSRQFAAEHPAVSAGMQRYDEVHQGIMAGVEVDERERAQEGDGERFGIIHGDLNVSNFFYDAEAGVLSVYDWDQAQRAWYLYDLAQSMITSVMFFEAGSLIDGSDVVQADPVFFEHHLISGYEEVAGEASVDRPQLRRCLALRKRFYETFCRRAQAEGAPPDMAPFIDYVVKWFDSPRRQFI